MSNTIGDPLQQQQMGQDQVKPQKEYVDYDDPQMAVSGNTSYTVNSRKATTM